MLLKIDVWRCTRLGVISLGVCACLMGCVTLPVEPPPPPPAPEPVVEVPVPPPAPEAEANKLQAADEAVRHVLAYHERLRQMTTAELAQELTRLNAAPGGPATTLETALALGQSRNNGDLARGLSLLESLLRINAPEVQPWQPVARLIAVRFAEQRKLEDQVERLNAQLKDSQRESQRKIDQLNEKLEALKAIERSLNVRPATSPAPVPKTP